jgi:hypothetical protein
VQRKIFGSITGKLIREWRKLHNTIPYLYNYPRTVRVINQSKEIMVLWICTKAVQS